MIGLIVLLTGIGIGAFATLGVLWPMIQDARARAPRPLPAATARSIDRARRRNRADLRRVLPAREQGVRVRLPCLRDFDEEHTQS